MQTPPILAAVIVALSPLCGTQAAEPASRPNIVLLYIDDWAWNGSPVAMEDSMPNSRMPILHMPNVERLAREGMKFRNAYGSPQCSPARVCVQTGQSSPRNGFTVFLGSKETYFDTKKEFGKFPLTPNVSDMEIDKEATTIPEALQPLGYVSAHIGKWHMRGDPGEHGYALHDGDTSNTPGNTLRRSREHRNAATRHAPETLRRNDGLPQAGRGSFPEGEPRL